MSLLTKILKLFTFLVMKPNQQIKLRLEASSTSRFVISCTCFVQFWNINIIINCYCPMIRGSHKNNSFSIIVAWFVLPLPNTLKYVRTDSPNQGGSDLKNLSNIRPNSCLCNGRSAFAVWQRGKPPDRPSFKYPVVPSVRQPETNINNKGTLNSAERLSLGNSFTFIHHSQSCIIMKHNIHSSMFTGPSQNGSAAGEAIDTRLFPAVARDPFTRHLDGLLHLWTGKKKVKKKFKKIF